MKIVSLNAWGGRVAEVYGYLESLEADVIMLQEVISCKNPDNCKPYDGRMPEKLSFEGYEATFIPFSYGLLMGKPCKGVRRGLAFLSREDLGMRVVHAESLFPERGGETGTIAVGMANGIAFANIHGIHTNSKTDIPERIHQSKRLIEIVENFEMAVVGGDFNLLPDTESMGMLSERWRDLIREYGVESTRTMLSPLEEMGIRHSDYMFLRGLGEKSFEVDDVVVSDHKPLIVEI